MTSGASTQYQSLLLEKLQKAFAQSNEIESAAQLIAACLGNQGWIYTSGTGHSHLLAEEIFYRAGGFARVFPILDPDLMLHLDATGSTDLERLEGYGTKLMESHPIQDRDVLILSSNSGRNAVPIEMAKFARKKGSKVIVITNLAHSQSVASRHSSGLKLYQLADVVLDNCGEIGDAAIRLPELGAAMGATSTVIGAALLHTILIRAAELCILSGQLPEVFHSSNSDIGQDHNQALIDRYKSRGPFL
jgi:uncharacterized phosphosugar-binding protein